MLRVAVNNPGIKTGRVIRVTFAAAPRVRAKCSALQPKPDRPCRAGFSTTPLNHDPALATVSVHHFEQG
jgi:hypothetical protein